MKSPVISRCRHSRSGNPERGITMILVAISLVAIIAMAALSIDVVTLYLAREEAQRSADAAALAAARVLSVSGITGDTIPTTDTVSWAAICGATGTATQTAQAVGIQNGIGNISPSTVAVTYAAGGASSGDCSTLPAAFSVNPMVTVQVTRPSLPTFFSRIWGNTGNNVSATATAEAFNPSDSGNVGNGSTGTITPVLPRCVKPWVVPNHDPFNPGANGNGTLCDQQDRFTHLTTPCHPLVDRTTGAIIHQGISTGGAGSSGTIGETFWLVLDCQHNPGTCQLRGSSVQPRANYVSGASSVKPAPSLLYVPGQVTTPVVAVPSCTTGDPFEEAIEGCDQSINYQCGSPLANAVDLTRNPGAFATPLTTNGVQCLTGQTDATDVTNASGQDQLSPFGAPSTYPFSILAGTSTPLAGLSGKPVSISNSIVSLPIYDSSAVNVNNDATTNVTFVGFLQVFINAVDQYGNVNVTVLNVAGCSNGTGDPLGSPALGSSPVPVRLITPP
jgi:Flp pilus assembly protein TadG